MGSIAPAGPAQAKGGTEIITADNDYEGLDGWLSGKGRVLLVCDDSLRYLSGISEKLAEVEAEIVRFSGFQPNPTYESVVEGVRAFREGGCEAIMAVGGGSAIDVAKCVKLYAGLPGDGSGGAWLGTDDPADVPLLAMPTTAGTGSEATRFAVIYHEGAKQSVSSVGIIPDAALLDPTALRTLPPYQRRATMCDALCHAIESLWSVNSTEESRAHSREAIRGVLAHMDGYLANTDEGNAGMMMAAHRAGRAIDITQTTAGHAMCYKITSLFGYAHGHAAMLCDRVLLPWMIGNTDRCIDPRGVGHLEGALREIASSMGCGTPEEASVRLEGIFEALGLEVPAATEEQYEELRSSVNPDRLRNHPVLLDAEAIDALYHEILR